MKESQNNNITDLEKYFQKTEELKNAPKTEPNPYQGLATGVGVFGGSTNINPDQYTESGLLKKKYMDNVYANADNDYVRAKEQGLGAELGNAVFKTLGQFAGDLIGFGGAILDAPQYLIEQIRGVESTFGNSIMDLGTEISDASAELFPVYKMNPNGTIVDQFNGEWDSAYWADIIPTAVATVADMVGSMGLMSVMRFASRKGMGLSRKLMAKQLKAYRAAEKAGRGTEAMKQIDNVIARRLGNQQFENGRDALLSAFVGRHFEGALEASQVQKESQAKLYDMNFEDLLQTSGAERFLKEKGRNPESKEELMDFIAFESANKAYKVNMANLFFDLYQLNAIPKIRNIRGFKRGSMKQKKGGDELKYRTKEAELLGKTLKTREKIFYGATPYMRTLIDAGSEAIEEGVNFIGTKEGEYLFGQLTGDEYEKSISERLSEYVQDDHFWDSAFMGAVGSTIMTPLMGRRNFKAATQSRLAELEGRKIAFGEYNQVISNIEKDEELTDRQKQNLKDIATRRFAGRLAKHAAANGDSKSLVSWLKSKDYKESLIADGEMTPEEADRDIKLMVDAIEHVAGIFEDSKKFHFLPNRRKRRSIRLQNNIINAKLNEEIEVFNMAEAVKEVKKEQAKHQEKNPSKYENLSLYGQSVLYNRAAEEVITEYGSQVNQLTKLKNKILGGKDRATLDPKRDKELLEEVERIEEIISEYEDFIKEVDLFSHRMDDSITENFVEGDQEPKELLKDRRYMELLKEEIQYASKADLHKKKSENEKQLEETGQKKIEKKESQHKDNVDSIIKAIEEVNSFEELKAFNSDDPNPRIKKAIEKKRAELNTQQNINKNTKPPTPPAQFAQAFNKVAEALKDAVKNGEIPAFTQKDYDEYVNGLKNAMERMAASQGNGNAAQKFKEWWLDKNKNNTSQKSPTQGEQQQTPITQAEAIADIEKRRQEDLKYANANNRQQTIKEGRENTKQIFNTLKEKFNNKTLTGKVLRLLEKLINLDKLAITRVENLRSSRIGKANGMAYQGGIDLDATIYDGVLKGDIKAIKTLIHELFHHVLNTSEYDAYKRGDTHNLSKKEIIAWENLNRIYQKAKANSSAKSEYGFTNLSEFLAEAFSNSSFQEELRTMEGEGKSTSLFKDILNSLLDLVKERLTKWAKKFNKPVPSIESGLLEDVMYWSEQLIDPNTRIEKPTTIDEINAKYDAELAALKEKTPTQGEPQKTPATQEGVNKAITLTEAQKKTIDIVKSHSDKIVPVIIEFEEGESIDGGRIPKSFKLAEEGQEYNGYINTDDLDKRSTNAKLKKGKKLEEVLLDRTTNYIKGKDENRDGVKFFNQEPFPAQYKQAGMVGTGVDEMAREIFDLLTRYNYVGDITLEDVDKIIDEIIFRYSGFKTEKNKRLLFGKDDNIPEKKRKEIAARLAKHIVNWYETHVYDKGLYLIPGETKVSLSGKYGGTTDIMLVDKQGRIYIADMKTYSLASNTPIWTRYFNDKPTKLEAYGDQLSAYRESIEELNIDVAQTALFFMGTLWKKLKVDSDNNLIEPEKLVTEGLVYSENIGESPNTLGQDDFTIYPVIREVSSNNYLVTYNGEEVEPKPDNTSDEGSSLDTIFGELPTDDSTATGLPTGDVKMQQQFKVAKTKGLPIKKAILNTIKQIDEMAAFMSDVSGENSKDLLDQNLELTLGKDRDGNPVVYVSYKGNNMGGIGFYDDNGVAQNPFTEKLSKAYQEGNIDAFLETTRNHIVNNGINFSTSNEFYDTSILEIFEKAGIDLNKLNKLENKTEALEDLSKKVIMMDQLSLRNAVKENKIDNTKLNLSDSFNGAQIFFSFGKLDFANLSSVRLSDEGKNRIISHFKDEIKSVSESGDTVVKQASKLNNYAKNVYGERTVKENKQSVDLPKVKFYAEKGKLVVRIPLSGAEQGNKQFDVLTELDKIENELHDLNQRENNSIQPIIIKEVFGFNPNTAYSFNPVFASIYLEHSLANTDQLYPDTYFNNLDNVGENNANTPREEGNEEKPKTNIEVVSNSADNKKPSSTSNKKVDKKEVENVNKNKETEESNNDVYQSELDEDEIEDSTESLNNEIQALELERDQKIKPLEEEKKQISRKITEVENELNENQKSKLDEVDSITKPFVKKKDTESKEDAKTITLSEEEKESILKKKEEESNLSNEQKIAKPEDSNKIEGTAPAPKAIKKELKGEKKSTNSQVKKEQKEREKEIDETNESIENRNQLAESIENKTDEELGQSIVEKGIATEEEVAGLIKEAKEKFSSLGDAITSYIKKGSKAISNLSDKAKSIIRKFVLSLSLVSVLLGGMSFSYNYILNNNPTTVEAVNTIKEVNKIKRNNEKIELTSDEVALFKDVVSKENLSVSATVLKLIDDVKDGNVENPQLKALSQKLMQHYSDVNTDLVNFEYTKTLTLADADEKLGFSKEVGKECAAYVQNVFQATENLSNILPSLGIFGNAWQMPTNVVDNGGRWMYNFFKSNPITSVNSVLDIKDAIRSQNHEGIENYTPDEGDVVGLFYINSGNHEKAYKQNIASGYDAYNTHVGLIRYIDNVAYIEHNVSGNVYQEPFYDVINGKTDTGIKIASIARPNIANNQLFEEIESNNENITFRYNIGNSELYADWDRGQRISPEAQIILNTAKKEVEQLNISQEDKNLLIASVYALSGQETSFGTDYERLKENMYVGKIGDLVSIPNKIPSHGVYQIQRILLKGYNIQHETEDLYELSSATKIAVQLVKNYIDELKNSKDSKKLEDLNFSQKVALIAYAHNRGVDKYTEEGGLDNIVQRMIEGGLYEKAVYRANYLSLPGVDNKKELEESLSKESVVQKESKKDQKENKDPLIVGASVFLLAAIKRRKSGKTTTEDFLEELKQRLEEIDSEIQSIKSEYDSAISQLKEKSTKEKGESNSSVNLNNLEDIEGLGDLFKLEDANLVNYEKENVEEFISWAKENLPEIEVKQLEEIISRTGVRAFGMFSNGVITLSKNAPIGTGYHEAFHFVANSLLTKSEFAKVLADAKKAFPAPNASDIGRLKSIYPQASDEFITNKYYEEQLADDFQVYKLTSAKEAPTTLIGKFFKKLLEFIKSWTKKPYNRRIQKLYKDINNGKFKNKAILSTYGNEDLKRIDFFDNYREQNKFTDSLTNYFYNIKNNLNKKSFEEISTLLNKAVGASHFIHKSAKKLSSKNVGKLVLFYTLMKKAKDVPEFEALLQNEEHFMALFDELVSKLSIYYQIKFDKMDLKEIDPTQDENSETHIEKQFDDGSLLKEKANRSMSVNLKRVLRSANHITSNKVNIKGQLYYISDIIKDIDQNNSKRFGLSYKDLKKMLEPITEEVLGVKSSIEFSTVNRFLERNLANINSFSSMNEKMYRLARIHPEVASALLEIKMNNQENTWFEHYKKNAYSMISVKDQLNPNDATFFADKETGYLSYVTQANRQIYNMFDYYKEKALKLTKKGGHINSDQVVKFLSEIFMYSSTATNKNLFEVALGKSSDRVHNKANIINKGVQVIKGIASAKNKDDLKIEHFLRMISESTKDYQLETNSNFNSGGKPFYGLTRTNSFSEKTDLINQINDEGESFNDAKEELDDMFRDPQLQSSNWIGKFFEYGSFAGVSKKNGFRGIKHGIVHQFGNQEYGDMDSNSFRKMNFMMYLSENFKRSDNENDKFYPQLLPTQSDSETPYYLTVPRFATEEEQQIAVQKMIVQDLARIEYVVEGLQNKSIFLYQIPETGLNKDGTIGSNSPILKIGNVVNDYNLVRGEGVENLKLSFKLENPTKDGSGTVIFIEGNQITIEQFAKNVISSLREEAKKQYEKEGLNIAGKNIEEKYADFIVNYMINSNEIQNFYTGKPFEFKNSEDKSKRGKNFTSSGLAANPTYGTYIKNKKGKYEPINTFLFNGEEKSAVRFTKYITLSDIKGRFTKQAATDIYESAKEDFNEEIAAKMLESFGYSVVDGKIRRDNNNGYDKGDAGSYGTWLRYEKLMRDRGKANPGSKLDRIFKKLHAGEDLTREEQIEFYQGQIAVEKPFHGDRRVGTSGLMESTMLKFGIMYMLPQTVRGTKLEIISDFMERNGFGEAHFNSAKKINRKKSFDLTKLDVISPEKIKDFNIQEEYEKQSLAITGDKESLNEPFADIIDNNHYRIQLENPDHTVDTDNLLGTQIAKLIMANIRLNDKIYDLNGDLVTGRELIQYYAINYSSIVSTEFELLLREIGATVRQNPDGTEYVAIRNFKKFREILTTELDGKDDVPDYIKEFIELNENGEFKVPMNFSPTKKEFQSILLAMHTKRISKIRMPGFSAAQVSNVFFDRLSDDVKNAIEWSPEKKDKVLKSELLHKDEDGKSRVVSAEIVVKRTASWMHGKTIAEIMSSKEGKESLEAIGYRIPTEAKSSMVRVKIVGFLPDYSKAMVVVPHDLVPKMGSDFDIDKLFFMMKTFFEDSNGRIAKQTFKNADSIERMNLARKNNMYDAFDSVLKNRVHYAELMYPQGFEDYQTQSKKIKKAKGIEKQNMNHNLFETQVEYRKRNMDGKRTLGIAANSNPAIPLFQISNAKVPEIKVKLAGQDKIVSINSLGGLDPSKNNFNDITGNKYVTINSGQGVGASADAAKDPTGSFMGLNPDNFGLFQFMITANFDIETASAISSSEVFKAYTKAKQAGSGSDMDLISIFLQNAMKEVAGNDNNLFKELMSKATSNLKELGYLDANMYLDERFFGKSIDQLKQLNEKDKIDWMRSQLYLLEYIGYFIKGSQDLVAFTLLTKPEGFGTGPDAFKTIQKMADLDAYRKKEDILITNSDGDNIIQSFLPNVNTSTTNFSPRDYNRLNFNDKEIFTHYYNRIIDKVKKTDC